jgi:hypothetical protein
VTEAESVPGAGTETADGTSTAHKGTDTSEADPASEGTIPVAPPLAAG